MTKSQLLLLSVLSLPEGPRFVHELDQAGLPVGALPKMAAKGLVTPSLYECGMAYHITPRGQQALYDERIRMVTPWWRRLRRWVMR